MHAITGMQITRNARHAAWLGLAATLAVGVASLGGIASPSTYAQETTSWAAQGLGQDWVNLLLVVPWTTAAALFTLRGSRRAELLLGGALVYSLYSYVIYAFAVHFNALFLVYCAALGLSFFALVLLLADGLAQDARGWFARAVPVRSASLLLIGVALLFGGMWLAQVIPALARGGAPEGLAEVGLVTNPVHVLDLSIVLPGLVVAAVALWRGQPLGYLLVPILLGFSVLMAAAIAGMIVAMYLRGVASDVTGSVMLAVVAVAAAAVLVRMLRQVAA